MKRINIKQAFVGEPNPDQEGIAAEASDELVQFEVVSGTFSLVVASNVPDDKVFENYGTITSELTLDNGMVVRFEIQDGAEGVTFMFNSPNVQTESEAGMSTATAAQSPDPAAEATEMAGGMNTGEDLPANQGA